MSISCTPPIICEEMPMVKDARACYDFLLDEAKLMGSSKPCWIPMVSLAEMTPILEGTNRPLKPILIGEDAHEIMSTLADKNIEVDIISTTTPFRTLGKRGPKQKKLTEDFIKKLSIEGLGSKAITTKLKNERGVEVSYSTVQRVISGQRL